MNYLRDQGYIMTNSFVVLITFAENYWKRNNLIIPFPFHRQTVLLLFFFSKMKLSFSFIILIIENNNSSFLIFLSKNNSEMLIFVRYITMDEIGAYLVITSTDINLDRRMSHFLFQCINWRAVILYINVLCFSDLKSQRMHRNIRQFRISNQKCDI